ncbi:ribonuclease domain-containing protein [uncultured Psychrobacter sp.]|uniref:ribonuclease domain-containing protein n=1 Tax=uncultured Psychrobacter sp. TaxID=259303 RepID=UPI0034576B0C
MQSGTIKHWNADKGYGFIAADDQSEDVFFHVSTIKLSQPIRIGQQVYFSSARNEKNQLRATQVTDTTLSLEVSEPTNIHSASYSASVPASQPHQNYRNSKRPRHSNQHKKNPLTTLISFIAIIAMAVYFFGDIKSALFDQSLLTADTAPSYSETDQSSNTAITGDTQIDNTIALIQQGGPYPYPAKDGSTFYNREGRLPAQSSGYYREYTVPTPGLSHRGARRIVTGGNPPTVYYLTVDHYDSFRQLQVN